MTQLTDKLPQSNEDLKNQLRASYEAEKASTLTPKASDTPFHTEVVTLPSQGVLYPEGNPLATGKLEMKYMTAKEEDILTSQNLIAQGVVIDKVLQSLIVTPINYDDLLLGDKNAILIAGRILAYGKNYEVEITCPNCREKSKETIDISKFEDKTPIEGTYKKGENIFEFELPASKRKITFKALTSADEKAIAAELKGLKKITATSGIDHELSTRMLYMIVSLDGKTDNAYLRSEVPRLLSQDTLAFRKEIKRVVPDIKMEVDFTCPACEHNANIPMPMDTNFFWPRA